jgi:hypothetical protein
MNSNCKTKISFSIYYRIRKLNLLLRTIWLEEENQQQ